MASYRDAETTSRGDNWPVEFSSFTNASFELRNAEFAANSPHEQTKHIEHSKP